MSTILTLFISVPFARNKVMHSALCLLLYSRNSITLKFNQQSKSTGILKIHTICPGFAMCDQKMQMQTTYNLSPRSEPFFLK